MLWLRMTALALVVMLTMTTLSEAAQTGASHLLAWDSPRIYTGSCWTNTCAGYRNSRSRHLSGQSCQQDLCLRVEAAIAVQGDAARQLV